MRSNKWRLARKWLKRNGRCDARGALSSLARMSSRLKDDIVFLVRALEGEIKLYQKQSDLLFTLLNTLVSAKPAGLHASLVRSELDFAATASKGSWLLQDQMVLNLHVSFSKLLG